MEPRSLAQLVFQVKAKIPNHAHCQLEAIKQMKEPGRWISMEISKLNLRVIGEIFNAWVCCWGHGLERTREISA